MYTVQYVCLCLPMEVKFRNVFLETKLTLKPGVTKKTPSLLFEDFTGTTLVYLACFIEGNSLYLSPPTIHHSAVTPYPIAERPPCLPPTPVTPLSRVCRVQWYGGDLPGAVISLPAVCVLTLLLPPSWEYLVVLAKCYIKSKSIHTCVCMANWTSTIINTTYRCRMQSRNSWNIINHKEGYRVEIAEPYSTGGYRVEISEPWWTMKVVGWICVGRD